MGMIRTIARLSLVLLLLAATLGAALPAAGIDRDVRDRVVPAAVLLSLDVDWVENGIRDPFPIPLGSGTIIDSSGLILTNAHVANPDMFAEVVASYDQSLRQDLPDAGLELRSEMMVISVSDGVRPPEPAWRGEIVIRDESLDLAVVRILEVFGGSPTSGPFPFVTMGDSSDIGLADAVHIFGYPAIGDGALTYTSGVVSGFSFESRSAQEPEWINTDAVMSGGSSGGTAVNDDGELIGIPTQGSDLDCRPGDTNGDGELTSEDVGCVPTGGSIGQLRPVNLAREMLRAAKARIASGAAAKGESPPAAARATATPRPTAKATRLPDFGFLVGFDRPDSGLEWNEPGISSTFDDGVYRMIVTEAGTAHQIPVEVPAGEDIGWRVRLSGFDGAGAAVVGISSRDAAGPAEWMFAVDPAAEVWSLHRVGQNGQTFFVWIEQRPYRSAAPTRDEPLDIILELRGDSPTLLIDGIDVARQAGVQLPEMPAVTDVTFGVGIDPGGPSAWSSYFSADFDEIELFPLP
jgi:S1-C subfamily serine protease